MKGFRTAGIATIAGVVSILSACDRSPTDIGPKANEIARVVITGEARVPRDGHALFSLKGVTLRGDTLPTLPDSLGSVAWSSSDPSVAITNGGGWVLPMGLGATWIKATLGGMADSISVTIYPHVASLRLMPQSGSVLQGASRGFFALAPGFAAKSKEWEPGELSWSVADSSIARVDAAGVVTGIEPGRTTVRATVGDTTATAEVEVLEAVRISSISAGRSYGCGVTTAKGVVCWGASIALGNETAPAYCSQYGCALTASADPLPVILPEAIASVATSRDTGYRAHSCALAESGTVYCWGAANHGQLAARASSRCNLGGSLTIDCAHEAVVAQTGALMTAVDNGNGFSCGLTAQAEILCWGLGWAGVTGGKANEWGIAAPAIIDAPEAMTAISTGTTHACALTAEGRAYCWGENGAGQLGLESPDSADHPVPTPISSDQRFAEIHTGYATTCGLTGDGQPHCWGGATPVVDGAAEARSQGLRFESLSLRDELACAVTADGRAYCWGRHGWRYPRMDHPLGEVGSGHQWRSISAGTTICGVTIDDVGYCWEGDRPVRHAGQVQDSPA